jgi:PadR family transcriptional regulator AphA
VLPTTSYAVLGMLAVQPWSAYELTKQMRRSLAFCWPKAESVLYDEPKRLVRLGLAIATDQPSDNGGRRRIVYTITPAGEQALRDWLATEPAPPRFELEPALRLLFADHSSKADLLRSVAATREWARSEIERGLAQLVGYRDDGGPFPQRLHIIVLFADLIARLLDALTAWTVDAEQEIQTWRRTRNLGASASTQQRLDQLIHRAETVLADTSQRTDHNSH